jgi:hypothetical protein
MDHGRAEKQRHGYCGHNGPKVVSHVPTPVVVLHSRLALELLDVVRFSLRRTPVE